MAEKSNLGDRMKFYEKSYSKNLLPCIPVISRLDGKNFHSFCKGLKRPYDKRLSDLMIDTTKFLVEQTNARCGYTQSDEITLVWLAESFDSEIFFAGKFQKMISVLSAMTSVYFNRKLPDFLPEKIQKYPIFDCRVFQVPTEHEATNCFMWREQDATRNSVMMAAQSEFSHKECQNKNRHELMDMLMLQKNINWNNYPDFFKRGTYVRRKVLEKSYNIEELENLPDKHEARKNPDLKIFRSIVVQEKFPPLVSIFNRKGVILHGEEPVERHEANKISTFDLYF